jgi:hypothetical protein
MLVQLLEALESEKHLGAALRDDLVARIDSHIRDLGTLRTYVIENLDQRTAQIEALITGSGVTVGATGGGGPENPHNDNNAPQH